MRINPETGLKRCSKCKDDKPPNAFNRDKYKLDGLCSRCRDCAAAYLNREHHDKLMRAHRVAHPERMLFWSAQQRAKRKNVPFSIAESDVYIPVHCPLCGCVLRQSTTIEDRKCSPSLDRQEPSLGYIPGNVWVICWDCNRAKQDMSGDAHIAFGFKIKEAFKEHCERLA